MMLNQNLVYITLRMSDDEVVKVVSRETRAASDICLKKGDVISGTRAGISTFVVTESELKPEEFKEWRQKHNLTIEAFCYRYNILACTVRKYEGE